MKYWCIIPAAGQGSRFGGVLPKQYLEVAGKPILLHTLEALLAHPGIAGAMLVLPANGQCPIILPTRCHGKPVHVCRGGASRAASVRNGLRALPDEVQADAMVLVHDAARPNVHSDDIDALLAALEGQRQGAILAAPVRDTLKRSNAGGYSITTEPRENLWRALTPQAFPREALLKALLSAEEDGVEVTDEAMAMERCGIHPKLVEGREDNFKITTPADYTRFAWVVGH